MLLHLLSINIQMARLIYKCGQFNNYEFLHLAEILMSVAALLSIFIPFGRWRIKCVCGISHIIDPMVVCKENKFSFSPNSKLLPSLFLVTHSVSGSPFLLAILQTLLFNMKRRGGMRPETLYQYNCCCIPMYFNPIIQNVCLKFWHMHANVFNKVFKIERHYTYPY